jgi:phosphatidate cytidylyltransferase
VTALVIAAVVLGILLLMPPVAAIVTVLVVVLAGAWEWAGFVGLTGTAQRLVYATAIGLAILAAWRFTSEPDGLGAFLRSAALWWLVGSLWVVLASQRGGRVAAACVGFAVLVPAAIGLGRLALVAPQGQVLLLFLIVLIAATDVAAYFGGRSLGKHKLAPRVSPNKTVEGMVAGVVGAAVAAVAGAALFGQPVLPWLGLCVLVALVSVIGDLVESMFKRRAGLKDSGGLLPGHGGVLDRIDSHAAAAPIFLLGLYLLGVAP